jgi:hypothetical protein
MKKFGTLGHSFCLCVSYVFLVKIAARRIPAVGATTARFSVKRATIRSTAPAEKGQFFSRRGREKFNYQFQLRSVPLFSGYQKKLPICRIFQKNLRKPDDRINYRSNDRADARAFAFNFFVL